MLAKIAGFCGPKSGMVFSNKKVAEVAVSAWTCESNFWSSAASSTSNCFLQCNDLFGQFLHTRKGLLESGLLTRNCCSATEQGINAPLRVCTSFERVQMFVMLGDISGNNFGIGTVSFAALPKSPRIVENITRVQDKEVHLGLTASKSKKLMIRACQLRTDARAHGNCTNPLSLGSPSLPRQVW